MKKITGAALGMALTFCMMITVMMSVTAEAAAKAADNHSFYVSLNQNKTCHVVGLKANKKG